MTLWTSHSFRSPPTAQSKAARRSGCKVKSSIRHATYVRSAVHILYFLFPFTRRQDEARMLRYDDCTNSTTASWNPIRVSLLSRKNIQKKKIQTRWWEKLGNPTALRKSPAKKDNSIFPLLWLQISCAKPSCRNLNLVLKFRWQATFRAHLDSCKAMPSWREGVQSNRLVHEPLGIAWKIFRIFSYSPQKLRTVTATSTLCPLPLDLLYSVKLH